jgi:hypothetical protein
MILALYILSVITIVYTVTNKDMFKRLREWTYKKKDNNLLYWLGFKLSTCEFCLALWVGIIMYFIVYVLYLQAIVYVLALPILSLFIVKLAQKLDI